MRRFLSIFFCILVPVILVMPVLGAELAGGYFVTGDCALGKGLTFYVPADYATGSLTYDSSGNLFNLTANTIYLYCPDYPGYTFSASRFSDFTYRTDSGYGSTTQDLNLKNIQAGNVEILQDSPSLSLGVDKLLVMILAVMIIGVGAFVLLRR